MSINIEISKVVDVNERIFQRHARVNSKGPQVEGFLVSDSLKAAQDESTVFTHTAEGQVPLLANNIYDSTANNAYYNELFGGKAVYRFMPVPLSGDELDSAHVSLEELLASQKDSEVIVVVMHEQKDMHLVTTMQRIASENTTIMEEIPLFDTRNGTEAAVIHLTGLPDLTFEVKDDALSLHDAFYGLVEAGECELYPDNGTTVLRPEVLTQEVRDHIWDIYNKQLDILIEQHPAYQRLTREELDRFLEDDSSLNVVHIVDGKVTTLFLGVTDLDTCPWLNKVKIKASYDEDLVYCPAIVTDFEAQGHNYAKNIIALLTDIVQFRGKNLRPYFECTNISASYIPKIIEEATIATGSGTLITKPVAKYLYRAFKISR